MDQLSPLISIEQYAFIKTSSLYILPKQYKIYILVGFCVSIYYKAHIKENLVPPGLGPDRPGPEPALFRILET